MESFEKNWYVLHTYSGYENKVKANIESRAQSMNQYISTFSDSPISSNSP